MASTQHNIDPPEKTTSALRASDDDLFGQVALGLIVLLLVVVTIVTLIR